MTLHSTDADAMSVAAPDAPASFPSAPVMPVGKKSVGVAALLKAHLELGKVRLNAMVVFTTALGFIVGAKQVQTLEDLTRTGIDWPYWIKLLCTCAGTFLAAVGASAFNQAIETRRDARMHRTQRRPLCTGVLSRTYAATFGLIISICGVALLCPTVNGLTATLAAANILIYALLYTPLKPMSTINTLVGAIVGGIPPVLGWTAATNELSAGGLVLGAILFVWQIPHFLALCWMYREDYARGGFKMLPIVDASGRLTSRMALLYAVLLMPLCLLVSYLQLAGVIYTVAAFVFTAGLILVAWRFASTRKNPDARRLFFASIIYLPLLCIVLMADARGPLSNLESSPAALLRPTNEQFVDPSSPEGRNFDAQLTTQPAIKP